MFDFHNIWFSIVYIGVSYMCFLGFYFGVLFKVVNEKKIFKKRSRIAIMYTLGFFLSGVFTYYLFEVVRFMQYMY